jgi:BirA family biotin operon repressor/biotin-[acetyl-CoA-carboxylase] ligase
MTFDIYYDDFIPTFPLFIAYCLHSLLLELFPLENLSIKWPNDIMWKNKKLGGILCEHNESEKKYIIGLGLNTNVSQDAIDGKLDIVTLSSLIGFPVSNEYLSDLIIANIYKKIDLLSNPKFYLNYINLWLYGLNHLLKFNLIIKS